MKEDLKNPCSEKKGFCINCHSEFMKIRPSLEGIIISKNFIRDFKNQTEMNSIV